MKEHASEAHNPLTKQQAKEAEDSMVTFTYLWNQKPRRTQKETKQHTVEEHFMIAGTAVPPNNTPPRVKY